MCTWVAEVCWLDDWPALNANDLVGCSISTRIRHNHLAPPLPWPFTSRRWAYPGGHGICHLYRLTFSSNFGSAHEHAKQAQQKSLQIFIFVWWVYMLILLHSLLTSLKTMAWLTNVARLEENCMLKKHLLLLKNDIVRYWKRSKLFNHFEILRYSVALYFVLWRLDISSVNLG